MDEYISREEAVKRIKSCISTSHDAWESGYNTAMAEIMEQIKHMPTADVQPVKHGRWELISQNKFTGTKTLRCTYCKNYFVVRDDTLNAGRGDANFCPNCGSKNRMEGDSDDQP